MQPFETSESLYQFEIISISKVTLSLQASDI